MTTKVTKYGIMIIAAVLLVTLVFAGAASADTEMTATQWNELDTTSYGTGVGTLYIKDSNPTSIIYPKDLLSLTDSLIIDFSGYKGTFAGVSGASSDNVGALVNLTNLNGHDLTIKNLNMTSVMITIGKANQVGGILGEVKGDDYDGGNELKFVNCHLLNCSIDGTYDENQPARVGGLVGDVNPGY